MAIANKHRLEFSIKECKTCRQINHQRCSRAPPSYHYNQKEKHTRSRSRSRSRSRDRRHHSHDRAHRYNNNNSAGGGGDQSYSRRNDYYSDRYSDRYSPKAMRSVVASATREKSPFMDRKSFQNKGIGFDGQPISVGGGGTDKTKAAVPAFVPKPIPKKTPIRFVILSRQTPERDTPVPFAKKESTISQ